MKARLLLLVVAGGLATAPAQELQPSFDAYAPTSATPQWRPNESLWRELTAGRTNPPPGPDKLGGSTHALRAGKDGTSQRRNYQPDESRTREEGRDDRRNGSDSGRN